MKVTADSITDDQILALRARSSDSRFIETCNIALGWGPTTMTGRRARERCAAVHNSNLGGGS